MNSKFLETLFKLHTLPWCVFMANPSYYLLRTAEGQEARISKKTL